MQPQLALALLLAQAGGPTTSSTAAAFTPPRLLHPAPPLTGPHPGEVALELSLDAAGAPIEVRLLRGIDPAVDARAVEVARTFRFAPATLANRPVPCTVRYRYHLSPAVPTATVAEAPRPPMTGTTSVAPAGVAYQVTVRGRNELRAASDFVVELGVEHTAPQAGGSGAELMRRAPGFFISQHSGEGKAHQIFLRGFDAVHGQDAEIQVGGVPVNEVSNIHAQGYADLHFLIPEVVRRMRVLEGASDVRQGDFAVAGSLDFDLALTRRGLLGRFTAGQHGLLRALLAFGPETEPAETFVAAELVKSDGFGPARASERASALGQVLLGVGGGWALRALAGAYAGRFDSAGVLREDELAGGRVSFFDSSAPAQGGSSQRHSFLLELRTDDGERSVSLSSWAVRRALRLRQNFTGYFLSPAGDLSEQENGTLTLGGRARYAERRLLPALDVEVGLGWRYDLVEQLARRLGNDGLPRRPEEVAGALQDDVDAELGLGAVGLYAELDWSPLPALSVRGGLRADALSFAVLDHLAFDGEGQRREALGFHLGPKLALRYRLSPLELFVSYGNGFRSPQALSLGQGERAPFTDVHSAEAGVRATPWRGLELTLATFYTRVAEDLSFDHVTGRTTVIGETTRLGGALVVAARPFDWLESQGSVTYARAERTAGGEQVPFVPPLVVRLDNHLHLPLGRLFDERASLVGSLDLSYLSPRPLPFSELGDAVLLLEASAGVELASVALSVEVFNLLDARWKDGEFVYASRFDPDRLASLVPARHFTAGRPLSAQLTLTVQL